MLALEAESFRPVGLLPGGCHHAFQSDRHASVTLAFVCRFDEGKVRNRFGFADQRLTCPEEFHDLNHQPFIIGRQRNLLLAFRAEDRCTEASNTKTIARNDVYKSVGAIRQFLFTIRNLKL